MARNHSQPLNRRIRQSRFESPQHEAMLGLLVAAGHLRERIEAVCARHRVTGGQYNVLRVLRGAHPDGYPRWDIARRLIERAPDVTRLIDRLADSGWVERTRSNSDRRLSVTRERQESAHPPCLAAPYLQVQLPLPRRHRRTRRIVQCTRRTL